MIERLYWVAQRVGATVTLTVLFLFFVFAAPPRFEMGTYELLVGKGPLSLPIFLLLLAACSTASPKVLPPTVVLPLLF